ncbi:acyltransferase family protein [Actinoplanes derwentensis]|uniref:Peptidoglycan/LPS O-acetylase OafA/YrhL, contains acyltransferase and SGNH-hydrolase domains n=1 Tax=Actinoplanes derwentensis TaxID=113562 RepID=A0A1H2D9Z8_9ACTN|nr:acyltransferase family protein [Actinoplanes derwentensis]GID81667.1 acyltransferase [Actinoplanes derwentensis]SDT79560.1 Peptidoglycan/LPS O-acetylase OafA/YrhL, contains acyltransferase and SGNH-hydrolase domains [Actinoplanes derwentensis]
MSSISTTTEERTEAPVSTPAHLRFRPDIEGMRAIAVTLVVLSHAGIATLEGGYVGVDVFFVISGFLITTLLLKELDRTGRISLATFYARRATRLLPASTVVLLVTVVASWLWVPATRFASIATDAIYATFYGINWRLASEGVQYMNAGSAPSPLQHFWSLAVEEQFYLIWPLLLLIFALFRGRSRTPVIVALVLVVATSLTVSVLLTASSAPWAYFGAHTRAWELAIGAFVAVGAVRLAGLPRTIAAVLTWGGLAAVVVSAFLYNEETPFPGYAAALPVLGSAAIIAGGCAAPRHGVVTLLRTWPFQQIGRYSYSWYLWHWPVLMIVPYILDVEPNLPLNLGLAAGALLLAVGSYHLVEDPARKHGWAKARARRGIAVGLALSAIAAIVAQVGIMNPPQLAKGDPAVNTRKAVAAAADPEAELQRILAASAGLGELPVNVTPKVERARWDLPKFYASKCHLEFEDVAAPGPCVFGDPAGTKSMYLFGDSHAAHWYPAMQLIARERGWKLMVRTKSACQAPLVRTYAVEFKRPYTECEQWRDGVLAEIRQARPAMVVISSNGNNNGGLLDAAGNRIDEGPAPERDALWAAGWSATFRAIRNTDTKLVLIEDTPWPGKDVPDCLATHSEHAARCARPPGDSFAFPARQALVSEQARALGVTVIPTRPWFCTDQVCPAVVGNIVTWRDHSHISTRYAAMLVPLLSARLPV